MLPRPPKTHLRQDLEKNKEGSWNPQGKGKKREKKRWQRSDGAETPVKGEERMRKSVREGPSSLPLRRRKPGVSQPREQEKAGTERKLSPQ